jgi:hypothetical protein
VGWVARRTALAPGARLRARIFWFCMYNQEQSCPTKALQSDE